MKTRLIFSLVVTLNLVLITGPSLTLAASLRQPEVRRPTPAASDLTAGALKRGVGRTGRSTNLAKKQLQDLTRSQSTTLLPDGSVLVTGGVGLAGTLTTAEIKRAGSTEITMLAAGLQRARAGHSATLLPDGKVLIWGGVGAAGELVNTPELFDPTTQTFELLGDPGVTARADHTATLLTDGHVLIAGGITSKGKPSNKADLWDSRSKTSITLPARLVVARRSHTATLLADGRVLLRGGKTDKSEKITDGAVIEETEAEAFDPESMRFAPLRDFTEPEAADPSVVASLPKDGDKGVPTDTWISMRFSRLLRVESVTAESINLTGPQGRVAISAVPAESGRLAFLVPRELLVPATLYTVSIGEVKDDRERAVVPTSFTFTTIESQGDQHAAAGHHHGPVPTGNLAPESSSLPDSESWTPDAQSPYDNWRSNGPESEWQKTPPLEAPAGVTAVAGQVLNLKGKPLAQVTLQIGNRATRTDSTGRFLLTDVPHGRHGLLINGATASQGRKLYATFENGVYISEGKTNVLQYTIWLPLVDTKHAVRIQVPTTKETVITNPLIPGLEIRIPKGVRLRAHDGSVLREISITPIPIDRTPMPIPPSTRMFFTPQGHGARVESVNGLKTAGIRFIYPNVTGQGPGTKVGLFDYASDKGWYLYGEATVSADGKQVVPDPGVGLDVLKCAYYMWGDSAPTTAPQPGDGTEGGDPVDLGSGLFVYDQVDLAMPDIIPISLSRTYRPSDSVDRPFGKGSTNPYDTYLWFSFWTGADVVLPDGSKIHYNALQPGTPGTAYEHTSTPTEFYKSTLSSSPSGGYDLEFLDGTVFHFGFTVVWGTIPAHYVRAPLEWIQDRNGNRLVITRDASTFDLRMTRITTPNGKWVEFSYDGTSVRIAQAKDSVGRTVRYDYDASGRLWKVTDPLNQVTEYTYDSSHRMLTIKDARNIVYLTNQYDANGRVTLQTQADGTTYQFAYTLASGKVTQCDLTDPRGNVRRVTFNTSGYLLTDTYAYGTAIAQTYTNTRQAGSQLVQSVTDALGRRTDFVYDSLGNATSVTTLAGTANAVTTSFTYNSAFQQLASVTDAMSHTVSFTYDLFGNPTSVTDPLSHQTTFTYNSAGQVLTATDALSHTGQFGYSAGELVTVTSPLGHTSRRFVDAAGRDVSMSNSLGQTTRITYDTLNLPLTVTDPLQGATSYSYDPNGNLLSVTDALGNAISYLYDNMDRVTTRRDALLREVTYEYYPGGLLKKATDRKGQATNLSHDALNRLSQFTYADGSTISYSYDSGNRLTQIVDSLSGTITYSYDNLDHLLSATTPQGTVSYTSDVLGRRLTLTVPGQALVTYSYDNASRLTQINQGAVAATFAYDNANRMTSQSMSNGVATEFGFDNDSRLTGITYKNGDTVFGNLDYDYDAAGRRIKTAGSFARTGLPSTVSSTSYNSTNQQTGFGGQTLTYDLNGNLTSDGTNTYGWNPRNELLSMSGPGLNASFQYDATGKRTTKTINGSATSFLYDGPNVVQEQASGSPTANNLTGGVDRFFSRTDASGTTTPLSDALGSTVALVDSLGALQTEYTFEPFGKTSTTGTANGNTQKYTGREDDGTGLYYYRARYYSPVMQRFISEDPIGTNGGINLFAYVGNDPVSYVDPLGLDKTPNFAVGPPPYDGWPPQPRGHRPWSRVKPPERVGPSPKTPMGPDGRPIDVTRDPTKGTRPGVDKPWQPPPPKIDPSNPTLPQNPTFWQRVAHATSALVRGIAKNFPGGTVPIIVTPPQDVMDQLMGVKRHGPIQSFYDVRPTPASTPESGLKSSSMSGDADAVVRPSSKGF